MKDLNQSKGLFDFSRKKGLFDSQETENTGMGKV